MKIYLAGPINGCTDAEANDWRTEAKNICHSRGHDYFDPMVRDFRGRENEPGIDREIVLGDKEDIKACDAVLVYYEKPSVGTSMEVLYAWERGIPVIVVNKTSKPLSPWLTYHSVGSTSTITKAIDKLKGLRFPIRRMNTYRYSFQSICPNNGNPIDYVLEIESETSIMVEDIIATVGDKPQYHEQLADRFYREFGGCQKLMAHHHGVEIVTRR